jgi:hypothetical protein
MAAQFLVHFIGTGNNDNKPFEHADDEVASADTAPGTTFELSVAIPAAVGDTSTVIVNAN